MGGMCSCLCAHIPNVDNYVRQTRDANETCMADVNNFLFFGRRGVKGMGLPTKCAGPFCKVLGSIEGDHRCGPLSLPSEAECMAMQLPTVSSVGSGESCPWLTPSEKDNVM